MAHDSEQSPTRIPRWLKFVVLMLCTIVATLAYEVYTASHQMATTASTTTSTTTSTVDQAKKDDCKPPKNAPKPAFHAKVTPPQKPTPTPPARPKAVIGSQNQLTIVNVQSPGMTMPQAPPPQAEQNQVTIVNVQSPATPAPQVAATPAPTLTPSAGSFEVIFSAVNWSEAIRPAFHGGRVHGPVIGQAMNAGAVKRFDEPVGAKLITGDGKVIQMRTELRERSRLPVNEAILTMTREEAVNFKIHNLVVEAGGFVKPTDHFIVDEIRSSAARGSARIVFFIVAAPGGTVPPPR